MIAAVEIDVAMLLLWHRDHPEIERALSEDVVCIDEFSVVAARQVVRHVVAAHQTGGPIRLRRLHRELCEVGAGIADLFGPSHARPGDIEHLLAVVADAAAARRRIEANVDLAVLADRLARGDDPLVLIAEAARIGAAS